MTVNILGTPYTLNVCSEKEDPRLADIDGLCDDTARELVAQNYQVSKDDPTAKKNLLLQDPLCHPPR